MKPNCSIKASALSIIPFILFGIEWLLGIYSKSILLNNIFFILPILSMFLLFGIGWVKGFPLWSVHSIGFCIVFSFLFTNYSSPGLGRHEIWGIWALLPLAVTIIFSIALNPSFKPLNNLLQMIKQEKNIVLFAFYGLLPLLFMMEFDEINSIIVVPFIIILTLLTAVSVIIYLRSSKKIIRTYTSIIGIVSTNMIAIIVAAIYWNSIIIK